MAIFTKRLMRCNSCGKTVELAADLEKLGFGGIAARNAGLGDWVDAGGNHHLCPDCSKPYLAKKAEMERELKALAGFETVEVDL